MSPPRFPLSTRGPFVRRRRWAEAWEAPCDLGAGLTVKTRGLARCLTPVMNSVHMWRMSEGLYLCSSRTFAISLLL